MAPASHTGTSSCLTHSASHPTPCYCGWARCLSRCSPMGDQGTTLAPGFPWLSSDCYAHLGNEWMDGWKISI